MKRALTIGVAGHVDHGKTTFVRSLTGIDTDRLGEEKRRGISIELGFAPLVLPLMPSMPSSAEPVEHSAEPVEHSAESTELGFVDMPGHERFVRRMISGAAGIDAVLLIVAADEGVMPQGREHLAICELLGVMQGAVVLTKVDLADDMLLELVREDVAELLAGSVLEGAPILTFSATDQTTWPGVRTQLATLAGQWLSGRSTARARRVRMPFRMPVDRSFVLPGRGTIVTGTAATGRVAVGDTLRVHPGDSRFRVRGVQRHGASVDDFAAPGRVALDLAGASAADVPVGAVLAPDGALLETVRLDAWLHALPHLVRPLKTRQRALVHLGTTHVEAAITQLSGEPLAPGEAGFVQLHLDRPLAVAGGERFIVRSSTADPRHGQTIAGGTVLHPAPARHRLGDLTVVAQLEQLFLGEDEDRVCAMAALARERGVDDADLGQHLDLPADAIAKAIKGGLARGRLRRFGQPTRYLSPDAVALLEARALAIVDMTHHRTPERAGIDEAELLRQIGAWLSPTMVSAIVRGLLRRAVLSQRGMHIARPGFKAKLTRAGSEVHDALQAQLADGGLAVTMGAALHSAVAARCGAEPDEIALACREAVADGRLVQIRAGYFLPNNRVAAAITSVFTAYADADRFSTGELKDVLGLTRKHLIPFAEFLDGQRLTIRDPDGNRRFRGKALEAWRAGERSWLGWL